MKHILGISALYHDSAAVLLKEGDIVAAAQEERIRRRIGALGAWTEWRFFRAAGGHTPGDLGHVTRRALFLTLQSGTAALVVPLDKPGAILHPFRAVLERVAARAPVVAVARETALVVVAQLVDDAGAVRSVADLS